MRLFQAVCACSCKSSSTGHQSMLIRPSATLYSYRLLHAARPVMSAGLQLRAASLPWTLYWQRHPVNGQHLLPNPPAERNLLYTYPGDTGTDNLNGSMHKHENGYR
eukprot:scaffold476618_cov35-Prasinocladus_malaysianus.AAC.1